MLVLKAYERRSWFLATVCLSRRAQGLFRLYSRTVRQSGEGQNFDLPKITETHKKNIDTLRFASPGSLSITLLSFNSNIHQSCPRAVASVPPWHRRISSSSTAINASPPCTAPGFARGKIGRSSTGESASFSTWGMETCRFEETFI
jgi:hypothetical protein